MRLRFARVAGTAVLATVLVVAGCSSSSGTAHESGPPSTAATVPASTRSASPSVSRSSAASSATTAAGTNDQLATRSKGASGGDSHGGVIVVFTNTSGRTCTMVGYPGAAVLDKAGRQIVQATRTVGGYLGRCGCTTPPHLSLKPGHSASAIVEGDDGGGDSCLRGQALLVTPPNTTKSTRISFQAYSCHVQVHPVLYGTAGTKT